ncbi:MAG: single-stranded DNA-binding protein [Prevotellaceae bacterium]|jgi:single-strand DNA-binding protein|nr:single-stranded DNA-binding protein [Prevotellaceae bacterium]
MVNKVILIGNVGADPEVRHFDTGVATTTIRMATSETYTDKTSGQRVTNTEWHHVVLWRQLAEFAEKYIRKGSQVYVEGRLRTRSWDDKDGQKRYMTEVLADVVRTLGRRDDATGAAPQQPAYAPAASSGYAQQPAATPSAPSIPAAPASDDAADDLPF